MAMNSEHLLDLQTAMQKVLLKEMCLELWRGSSLVKLTELLKVLSLACLTDELMATQTEMMTEMNWVLLLVNGLEQMMEMLMARSLVHLSAVRTAM